MEEVTKDGVRFFIREAQLMVQPLEGDPVAIASDVLRILEVTHTAASDDFYTIKFERLNGEVAFDDLLASGI